MLEEFESASPYYRSETDGQLYLEFPNLPAPMMGPTTKYHALFDARAMFQPCREALLQRYGARMTVFRDKFLDVIQGVEMDGPLWENVVQLADLLNELQNSNKPRSGPFEGFFASIYSSYIAALTAADNERDYYLSTLELLALCNCRKQNVVIVRRLDNQLHYVHCGCNAANNHNIDYYK